MLRLPFRSSRRAIPLGLAALSLPCLLAFAAQPGRDAEEAPLKLRLSYTLSQSGATHGTPYKSGVSETERAMLRLENRAGQSREQERQALDDMLQRLDRMGQTVASLQSLIGSMPAPCNSAVTAPCSDTTAIPPSSNRPANPNATGRAPSPLEPGTLPGPLPGTLPGTLPGSKISSLDKSTSVSSTSAAPVTSPEQHPKDSPVKPPAATPPIAVSPSKRGDDDDAEAGAGTGWLALPAGLSDPLLLGGAAGVVGLLGLLGLWAVLGQRRRKRQQSGDAASSKKSGAKKTAAASSATRRQSGKSSKSDKVRRGRELTLAEQLRLAELEDDPVSTKAGKTDPALSPGLAEPARQASPEAGLPPPGNSAGERVEGNANRRIATTSELDGDTTMKVRDWTAPSDTDDIAGRSDGDLSLDLADIMMSMGLTDRAEETLRESIAEYPKQSLAHRLKLISLYRRTGQKEKFLEAAQAMQAEFNVAAPIWSVEPEPAANIRQPSLEDYPHVMQQISRLWPQPACADYLDKLLGDNRQGTRTGFNLAIAEEILFLLSLLRV